MAKSAWAWRNRLFAYISLQDIVLYKTRVRSMQGGGAAPPASTPHKAGRHGLKTIRLWSVEGLERARWSV